MTTKKHIITSLLVSLAALASCGTTQNISTKDTNTLALINTRAHNENATVILADGQEYTAQGLAFTKDSAFWSDPATSARHAASLTQMKQVSFNNHLNSALTGLVYGAPIGFVAGFGVGYGQGDDAPCRQCTAERKTAAQKGINNALIFGGAGAAAGAITGAILGQKTEYNFR